MKNDRETNPTKFCCVETQVRVRSSSLAYSRMNLNTNVFLDFEFVTEDKIFVCKSVLRTSWKSCDRKTVTPYF